MAPLISRHDILEVRETEGVASVQFTLHGFIMGESEAMTMPPEIIHVKCPKCEHVYEDWYRGSINLTMDHFDEEYIEEATTAKCPNCGLKVSLGAVIVREDGVWEIEC